MRFLPWFAALFLMGSSAMAADMYMPAPATTAPAPYAPPVRVSKTPACDNPFILRDARRQFAHKEHAYWSSSLTIDGFANIRETAFRPWKDTLIERRFCSADALLSDTSSRKAYYSIAYRTGLAGTNFGVEVCVESTDRNLAYAPNCKMAQP